MKFFLWEKDKEGRNKYLKHNEEAEDKKPAAVVYNAFNIETMIKNMEAGHHKRKKKDAVENEKDDECRVDVEIVEI